MWRREEEDGGAFLQCRIQKNVKKRHINIHIGIIWYDFEWINEQIYPQWKMLLSKNNEPFKAVSVATTSIVGQRW